MKAKWFIIGIIFTLIITLSFPSLAYVAKQKIEVTFNEIKIKVNNADVTKPNILYNGTTYVPLRAIGEILNKDVVWEGATKTAHINDKVPSLTLHKFNDVVSIYDLNVTLHSARVVPPTAFSEPQTGYKYIAVDVSIENKRMDEYDCFPAYDMNLQDENSFNYQSKYASDLQGELQTKITPGNTVRGEVAFEVPVGAKTFKLKFSPWLKDAGQIFYQFDIQ